jgi:adenylate kinase
MPQKPAAPGKKDEPPKKDEPAKQLKIFIYELDSYLGKVLGERAKRHAAEGEQPIIVGCLQDPRNRPTWADEIIRNDDLLALKKALLSSDVIVYDLSSSPKEATSALKVLLKYDYAENPEEETEKVMIGVSSLLSWAGNSVPLPEGSEGAPSTDLPVLSAINMDDRKPHPNYKAQVTVENLVINKGNIKKDKLKTYVIWSGVLYGCGEGVLHSLFKCSWTGTHKSLPVLGNGLNKEPMIHISDLSGVVLAIAQKRPQEFNTFVAADHSDNTLLQVVTSISTVLQEGEVRTCSRDEYLAFMTQQDEPHLHSIYLSLNLKLNFARGDAIGYGPEGEAWRFKSGIVDNISKVVDEYRAWRSLQPMRVLFFGPPASGWVMTGEGRLVLSRDFAEEYQVTFIDPQAVADEYRQDTTLELGQKLREAAEAGGAPPAELVREAVQRKLQTPACRNQGWVLDGYPATREEAEQLFDVDRVPVEGEPPADEEPPPAQDPPARPAPVPESVFALGASREFLQKRIAALTEEEAAAAGLTAEEFEAAFDEHAAANAADEAGLVGGVVGLLRDNRAKGCLRVVDVELEAELSFVQDQLRLSVGEPRNYDPSRARREREAAAAARAEQREREAAGKREAEEAAGRAEREAKARADAEKLGRLQAEERESLLLRSQPMRKYLMENVLPTLTKGLQEVRLRPLSLLPPHPLSLLDFSLIPLPLPLPPNPPLPLLRASLPVALILPSGRVGRRLPKKCR